MKSRRKDRKNPVTEPTLSQQRPTSAWTDSNQKKIKNTSDSPIPEGRKKDPSSRTNERTTERKPNPGLHTDVIPENNICRPVFPPPRPQQSQGPSFHAPRTFARSHFAENSYEDDFSARHSPVRRTECGRSSGLRQGLISINQMMIRYRVGPPGLE